VTGWTEALRDEQDGAGRANRSALAEQVSGIVNR
jgi:hypothetical protein